MPLTAYILAQNKLIDPNTVMSAHSLPSPNAKSQRVHYSVSVADPHE
jgi:hypothetical protein